MESERFGYGIPWARCLMGTLSKKRVSKHNTWEDLLTPEREAVFHEHWPTGMRQKQICELINDLPGPPVNVQRISYIATSLGLQRRATPETPACQPIDPPTDPVPIKLADALKWAKTYMRRGLDLTLTPAEILAAIRLGRLELYLPPFQIVDLRDHFKIAIDRRSTR